MHEAPKSHINTAVFSLLCIVLGLLSGWILALLGLAGATILLWPALWFANQALQALGKSATQYEIAEIIYPFLLFAAAPMINYIWVRIVSSCGGKSRTFAAWSLAFGAAVSYFEFGKTCLLHSESDTVKMTWAPAIATGVIGLAVGAYLVSRLENQKRRDAD